jgi:hypothetical protein
MTFPGFQHNGFAVVERILPDATCLRLLAGLADQAQDHGGRQRAGSRNLLTSNHEVRTVAQQLAGNHLSGFGGDGSAFPVRALFFDKTPDANWKVHWHQDLSIAVAERCEVPGFTGWSLKEGIWHVQPPADVLERMITLRLHLDDCGPDNGPLKVLPGSHREGRLSRERIEWWKTHGEVVECHLAAGGALLMRPLLLHSSSPATKPSHRRVLHVEFAAEPLPAGLQWAVEAVPHDMKV